MLGIEAAIISVFGTVLGLVVGVAAGVVIRAVYASEGLETLAIPWLQLLVFLAAVDCGRSGVQHLPRLPRVEAAGP